MSEIASALRIPPTFTFAGKEYKVSARTFEIEALAERRILQNALDGIKRFRDDMDAQTYSLMLDGWRRDMATKRYAFGGPDFIAWACSVEGMKYVAFLQLSKFDRTVNLQLIDKIWENAAAWEELNLKMVEADQDPFPKPTSAEPAAA